MFQNIINICSDNRYIFELGSGTTKLTVYDVDMCSNSIKILSKYVKMIPIQNCLSNSNDNNLKKGCVEMLKSEINSLKINYDIDCKINKCYGFATAWARIATNGLIAIQEIQKETEIKLTILTQNEEGQIANHVAKNLLLKESLINSNENFLLMDVGSGSFQLIVNEPKEPIIYNGSIGTVSLTKMLEENGILHDDNHMIKCSRIDDSNNFLDGIIRQSFQLSKLSESIRNSPYMKLYAVGSSALEGLYNEFELSSPVLLKDLETLIYKLCDKDFQYVLESFPKRKKVLMPSTQAMFLLIHRILILTDRDRINVVLNANPSD